MEYFFVGKFLSEADVTSKLTLLSEWVGDGKLFPAPAPGSESEAVPIPTKDELGNDHTFMLKVRRPTEANGGQRRYNMRPEFQRREWHAYAVERGLVAGDVIYFWWDNRGFFRVQARDPPRPYRLFGTNFLY